MVGGRQDTLIQYLNMKGYNGATEREILRDFYGVTNTTTQNHKAGSDMIRRAVANGFIVRDDGTSPIRSKILYCSVFP